MPTALQHCHLLELPPELRLIIYKFYLIPPASESQSNMPTIRLDTDPITQLNLSDLKTKSTVLCSCRSMNDEAMPLFQATMEAGVQYWLKATSESQQQILNSYRQDTGFRLCTNWDPEVVKRGLQMWLEGLQRIEQFGASTALL